LDDAYADKIRIFDTRIPSTVRVGEANSACASIIDFDAKNKAAAAYTAFTREVIGYASRNG
jgi:chromosome partitioning protein